MLMYFLLSGAHRTLPYAELNALAEVEAGGLRNKVVLDQLVIADSTLDFIDVLKERSVLVRYGGPLLTVAEVGEGLREFIKGLRDSDICKLGGFSHISFTRIKSYGHFIRYNDLVREIVSRNVELCRKPKAPILDVVISEGIIAAGLRYFRRDLSLLRGRDPQRRPVYKPGTLTPIFSRLFVNLSRVSRRSGEKFLDPFCGVGGFLLEACAMKIGYVGSDMDYESVRGASINLKYYGCVNNVIVANACDLPYVEVTGIGTDPPYGRLSRARWLKLEELMECFLYSASEVLPPGRFLVFAQRSDINLEDAIREAGFRLVEKHLNWVHGALTRNIYVVMKA